jgi:hypothetical protein
MEEPKLPKFDYYLDESDPDVVVLRRQDGAFVAAFSARGATTEGLVEAAKEDYRKLLLGLRAREEQKEISLDELPEQTAIVDSSGAIVAVNKAWKRFAKDNGADLSKVSEGANYLDVCERATGEHSQYAQSFGEGLRSVLCGREERFAMEYPCHSPTEKRWFVGSVRRFADGDLPMALVAHENVTRRKSVLAH